MNSAIQCLVHTPEFARYFWEDYHREINWQNPLGMVGELALAFGELLRKLWAPGRTPVAPRPFKAKLARFAPQFIGYNQHDSQLQKRLDPLCVVADDSVFSSLFVVRLSRTARVLSLFPGLRDKGVEYLQTVADANGILIDQIEVPQKRKLNLTMEHQKKVDLLIGEPYYFGNDGMIPWQNLHFWKERTMLDSVLSKDVLIMPCKGVLKACTMSLPNLWNSCRYVKKVEGFDHSVVNTVLGSCGDLPPSREGPCLPFYVWQCGDKKELSDSFTIIEFFTSVNFTAQGICHGFALWIDWVLDAKNFIVVSTGPAERYWKQGARLLSKPVSFGIQGSGNDDCSRAVIEASFDPTNGELVVKHKFS